MDTGNREDIGDRGDRGDRGIGEDRTYAYTYADETKVQTVEWENRKILTPTRIQDDVVKTHIRGVLDAWVEECHIWIAGAIGEKIRYTLQHLERIQQVQTEVRIVYPCPDFAQLQKMQVEAHKLG